MPPTKLQVISGWAKVAKGLRQLELGYSKTCVKQPLSKRPIIVYCRSKVSYHLSLRSLFYLFFIDHFTQVLLYLYCLRSSLICGSTVFLELYVSCPKPQHKACRFCIFTKTGVCLIVVVGMEKSPSQPQLFTELSPHVPTF